MEGDAITRDYCEEHMQELEGRIDGRLRSFDEKMTATAVKFAELESSVKSIKGTLNLVLGAVVSGMGSIIVILLTRGI